MRRRRKQREPTELGVCLCCSRYSGGGGGGGGG